LPARAMATETMQIAVNAQARTFVVARPVGGVPRPTLIVLHGRGGTGASISQEIHLDTLGPRDGFVAVFPNGRGGGWNHFPPGKAPVEFARLFDSYGGLPDDVAFLKQLVDDLVRRGISDPTRIYLAGFSAGGFMTLRMACIEAQNFAAIAVLIGTMSDTVGEDCHPAKPIGLLVINGTDDPVVPYVGGVVRLPRRNLMAGSFAVWSTPRLATFFQQLNGCSGSAERVVLANHTQYRVEVDQWVGCAHQHVVLYRIIGGAHWVPPHLNSGQLILDFFRKGGRATLPLNLLTIDEDIGRPDP
jgi:polyhydroxybutyrate depolymerase